jgi:hypothetical protein
MLRGNIMLLLLLSVDKVWLLLSFLAVAARMLLFWTSLGVTIKELLYSAFMFVSELQSFWFSSNTRQVSAKLRSF